MISWEPLLTFATDTPLRTPVFGHGRYNPDESAPLDIRVMKHWGGGWAVRSVDGRWTTPFYPVSWSTYSESI